MVILHSPDIHTSLNGYTSWYTCTLQYGDLTQVPILWWLYTLPKLYGAMIKYLDIYRNTATLRNIDIYHIKKNLYDDYMISVKFHHMLALRFW